MSAGDGYRYLLRTVAAADGDRELSTPLTRYYVEEGTPPGQWFGAGVTGLGKGQLAVGDRVSEAQLQLLMGMGRDPITGDPLGHAFPAYKSVPERIDARIADLDPGLSPGAKGEAVARIEAEETERGKRRAVAGFDFTFSIPKSASALWGITDDIPLGALPASTAQKIDAARAKTALDHASRIINSADEPTTRRTQERDSLSL
ncbi:hypothetical protein GGQ54_000060 [Naumannella cuiyingiana]|uniref:TrwC relaxase domain-containing protein n=1 Tax=Naumannella cuiyingiana TaxID=1347891 RepID=A0A7Z0IJF4_9ACTN|nr:relaxase domain-containing protein [Naumannella cuiyingiana]NYI69500.1 hypothetical protein [Naumannella cuiyingiana]